jgi:hypothetical protein
MKKYSLALFFALCLAFASTEVFAQPGFDDDVTDTPIDGGISLLVGAGVAYGAKKLHDKKKNQVN